MTKQEKIKEAFDYGYNSYHECNTDSDYEQHLKDCTSVIQNDNNGWIKIENEDDLPKDTINYYVFIEGSLKEAFYRGSNRWATFDNPYPKTTEVMKITHYQPIEKPELPIY